MVARRSRSPLRADTAAAAADDVKERRDKKSTLLTSARGAGRGGGRRCEALEEEEEEGDMIASPGRCSAACCHASLSVAVQHDHSGAESRAAENFRQLAQNLVADDCGEGDTPPSPSRSVS